ncbi:hypothetical protein UlMin_036360 [Ulmus minor]
MADQKVTIMVLKVDLQCCRCYKKIKKVLCKFPQIRDQAFDEKTNTIVIKVVCCSPEKIKQKIICKAGDTLKSIEIKEPEKPKPKPPPPSPPPPPLPPPSPPRDPPPRNGEPPQRGIEISNSARVPAPALPKLQPIPLYYPQPAFDTCSSDCYHGNPGGACYQGYGGLPPQCYQYDGYCGRSVYDSYGGGTYYMNENPDACSIM